MAKKTLKESGLAWRPFREMSHNATYIDSKTGEIIRTPSETSEVLVDAGTGQMIDPGQLFLDNEDNIGRTNTRNQNVVLPYRYEYKLMPYHDTKRVYKVPVYNNDSSNNVTPEDAKRFGIKWEPELVGEDNWQDPSENILNYGIAGGIAFPTLTSSLVAGELGGAGFNALYQATHNKHSMEQDGVNPLYNLGYWFGGDAGYKGYKYLANNVNKVYPWMLRTFGSKGSRLGHTMNQYMGFPTVTTGEVLNRSKLSQQVGQIGLYNDVNFNMPYLEDDFVFPPDNLFDNTAIPATGEKYQLVGGYSVNKSDLDKYQTIYPEATNVQFGEIAPTTSIHRQSPTITSDIPSTDLQGAIEYFKTIIQPLAKRHGYSLKLPEGYNIKYYREVPHYTEVLGTVTKNQPIDEKWLGGWHDGLNKNVYINYSNPESQRLSLINHELVSHGTDKQLSSADQQVYQNLVDFLKDNQTFRLSGPATLNIQEANNWNEMRATLNEIRSWALKNNKVSVTKYGDIDTSNLTDNELLDIMSKISGYGQNYFNLFKRLHPNKRKQWLRSVRRAIETAPVATIAITQNE